MKQELTTTGRRKVSVICVAMTTVKARKIINRGVRGYGGDLRAAYLQGVRDAIGGDMGFNFVRGVESGDVRNVARFCRDGWRVLGQPEMFTARMDLATFLQEMRRLCENACRDVEVAGRGAAK